MLVIGQQKLHIVLGLLFLLCFHAFNSAGRRRGSMNQPTAKMNNLLLLGNARTIGRLLNLKPNLQGFWFPPRRIPAFKFDFFPRQEDIISKKIKDTGVYDSEETFFIKHVSSDGKGGWAVDIGANIGFHNLHMAALGAKVIVFEPSRDKATLLRRSIKPNGFD